MELTQEIKRLKAERNAVIVAHNYQIDEVQDIADYVGDSFYLSKICAQSPAKTIVFCGVQFMAESAKVLSPEKTVLLPEAHAGCPMADSITPEDVRKLKAEHPNAVVVCYINSSVEVKAECDLCCTSSNAVRIVRGLKEKEVIFVPDRNLGSYVASQVPDKHVILFDGCCITHARVTMKELNAARARYPDAPVAVHPECSPEIVAAADFAGSTSEIIEYCRQSSAKRLLIGTEMGVLHKLKQDNPEKEFYLLTPRLICTNMKKTTLQSVYRALAENRTQVEVEESIRLRARTCLERMLNA